VELANLSDVGCIRTVNEDYFLYAEPEDQSEFMRRGRLLVVADGMGGHQGGEVASGIAAQIVRNVFFRSERDSPVDVLAESFDEAQQAILDAAGSSEELADMGTTCSAAIVKQGWASFGHIGDSRIYLVREGSALQMTEDHTLVNELFSRGAIAREEIENHPQRNVLTSALGSLSPNAVINFSEEPMPLKRGDVLLLCSDGLHGLVSAEEMCSILDGGALSDACRSMVDLAKRRGGADNITVQLLKVKEEWHDRSPD